MMKRIAIALALFAPVAARAQYMDGLPAVTTVPSTAITMVCVDGKAGHPGTCKTRQAPMSAIQSGITAATPVAANGVTNTLGTWMGYLSGSANPNPMVLTGPSTAALIADAAGLAVQLNNPTVTANYLYRCLVSASCSASVFTDDAIRGIATNTAGTTNSDLITGLAGYFLNNAPASGGRAVNVGVGAYGVCAVNGSNCWGFDSIISDNLGLNTSTGTGKGLYNEYDFNVTSQYTIGGGLMLGGTWLVQPAGINGFAVNTPWGSCGTGPCAPWAKWANGLLVQNGAASVGLNIGAANYTASANVASMPIYLGYWDASATLQNVGLTALGGQLYVGGTAPASVNVVNGGYAASVGNGLTVGTQAVATASATTAFLASGSGFTAIDLGNGTATVNLEGPVAATAPIQLASYTVAALPACGASIANSVASVTDATAPTYNGTLTGGGTMHIPVFCNGTSWMAH